MLHDKKLLCAILLGLGLGGLGLVGGVLCKPTSVIAVFDMKRALNQTAELVSRTQMTPEAQSQLLSAFSGQLPQVLTAYGASHHVTVIAATVLASEEHSDITPLIIEETLERLKHHE